MKDERLRVDKVGLLDLFRPFMKGGGLLLYSLAYATGATKFISDNLEMQRESYIKQRDQMDLAHMQVRKNFNPNIPLRGVNGFSQGDKNINTHDKQQGFNKGSDSEERKSETLR